MNGKQFPTDWRLMPMIGVIAGFSLWCVTSAACWRYVLLSVESWHAFHPDVSRAFNFPEHLPGAIVSATLSSLMHVAVGYLLAMLIGIPVGVMLEKTSFIRKTVGPLIHVLKIAPAVVCLLIGLVLFGSSEPSLVFTTALSAMWPVMINVVLGIRSIPVEYQNLAKVLRLSRTRTLILIQLPSALPWLLSGARQSLGLAWFSIITGELFTGLPGLGGMMNREVGNESYDHLLLCFVVIGVIALVLDRAMNLVERRFQPVRGEA